MTSAVTVPPSRSVLAHALKPGAHGARTAHAVTIAERRLACVLVATRREQDAALAAVAKTAFGAEPPGPGHALLQGAVTTVWIQPGCWLITEPLGSEGALAARLERALAGHAAIVDQSHGKACIRIAGASARHVLAKGCRIDLHPRVFGPGRAAVTPIAHVNCLLVQTDAGPTFDLIVPSTLAESLLAWLEESAAEFGYTMS